MNNSYRIQTNINGNADKHIKIKLEQDVSQFEILSLKISQNDFYPFFNCQHGVLVGRVIANDGVGIPNAKVSIFIPLSEEDEDSSSITALYPYKNPRDKNYDGKRYNLLPRAVTLRPDGAVRPKQAFGSLPLKEEIVTNETIREVYKKYYKYSTITNDAGDYMLFGVPVGIQTVHLSVDITDIGKYSMKPSTMVTNLGYSPNLFTDNNTRIKESDDLNNLPHIETQDITVDVIPFCGDDENYEIGITRQDFRIRAELISTFIVFGTSFTDGDNHMWGDQSSSNNSPLNKDFYKSRGSNDFETFNIGTKRIAEISEKIFALNNDVSDTIAGDGTVGNGTFDPSTDYTLLSNTEYSKFVREGDFAYILKCNRRKIITNDFGEEVVVPNDYQGGIFTEFKGFFIFEYTNESAPHDIIADLKEGGQTYNINSIRMRLKFPQRAKIYANGVNVNGHSFDNQEGVNTDTDKWRKQFYTFTGGEIYSVARFNAMMFHDGGFLRNGDFLSGDILNTNNSQIDINSGEIVTNNTTNIEINEEYGFPKNATTTNNYDIFGGNWMNLCIYFPQFGAKIGNVRVELSPNGQRVNTMFTKKWQRTDSGTYYIRDNTQEIAAGVINTVYLGRSDINHTDFIRLTVPDITLFREITSTKGFTKTIVNLNGQYKNGSDYINYYGGSGNTLLNDGGGKINLNPSAGVDPNYYFYKGLDSADCISYLFELGLV